MTPQARAEELRRYHAVGEWPLPVLPLKRYVARSDSGLGQMLESAYVVAGPDGAIPTVVCLSGDQDWLAYPSLEALVDDGWVID